MTAFEFDSTIQQLKNQINALNNALQEYMNKDSIIQELKSCIENTENAILQLQDDYSKELQKENREKFRFYRIGDSTVFVDVGSDYKKKLPNLLKSDKKQIKVIKGMEWNGERLKFSPLERVALFKALLGHKKSLKCSQDNFSIRDVRLKYCESKYIGKWLKFFNIDHLDNNPQNNKLSNFQILCSSCNQMKVVEKELSC